ncbi:MAG: DUF6691 family protein [Nitrospirota bacterium]
MNAPLFAHNLFSYNFGLVLALMIGFFFGFLLERAGLGNPRKLTAIFYFEDFTVLKVMFSAILTSAVGIWFLSKVGAINMAEILVVPTYIWPQLIGGFLLGIGFVIGGYCPGTAVVGMSSGRIDAIIFIFGLMLGIWIFAEGYPYLKSFYLSGYMADITLNKWLGTSRGIIILVITFLAFIAFWASEKAENK